MWVKLPMLLEAVFAATTSAPKLFTALCTMTFRDVEEHRLQARRKTDLHHLDGFIAVEPDLAQRNFRPTVKPQQAAHDKEHRR